MITQLPTLTTVNISRKRRASFDDALLVKRQRSDGNLPLPWIVNINYQGKPIPPSNVRFTDLPTELMMEIFNYLDIKSLVRLAQVNKQIRGLSEDDSLWKSRCQQKVIEHETTFLTYNSFTLAKVLPLLITCGNLLSTC